MPADAERAATRLAGDALLVMALRAPTVAASAMYAQRAILAYHSAIDNGLASEVLMRRMAAADKLVSLMRNHLLERGSEAGMVGYALATPEYALEATAPLKDRQPSDFTIASVAETSAEYELGRIVMLACLATERSSYVYEQMMCQWTSGLDYLKALRDSLEILKHLVPMYREFVEGHPTTAAKFERILTKNPKDYAALQDELADMLLKA